MFSVVAFVRAMALGLTEGYHIDEPVRFESLKANLEALLREVDEIIILLTRCVSVCGLHDDVTGHAATSIRESWAFALRLYHSMSRDVLLNSFF